MDESPDVVGRTEELAAVEELVGDADNLPAALLIEGEPGIGKTTLWRVGLELARKRGFEVLACRAAGAETELSFAALGDLLEIVQEPELRELPAPQRRALRAALLLEEPQGGHLDQRAVAVAFLNVVRGLARRRPVVVAVDDVQWLDRASAATLEFAARRLGETPVALLLARLADGEGAAPLDVGRAVRPGTLVRLALGPLSLGALHRILVVETGTAFSRPAIRRVHELSGGNPFYALELARGLKLGTVQVEAGAPLPAGLQELVSERVAALPDDCRRVLAASAAVSRPTIDLLDAVFPDGTAGEALAAASEAHVIELRDGEVRFLHPLLRSAAYGLSTGGQRRDLHRRLASLLVDVEERARHLALSTEKQDEKVATAVEEGASAAFRRGAPAAAAELAEQAVRLTPRGAGEQAKRRALAVADYSFEAGDTDRALSLLQSLIAASPAGPERAHLLSRLARVRHFGEDVSGGVELLRQALAEAGEDAELRANIEEGLAWGLMLMRSDLPAAARHAAAAARFAEQQGDRAALAEALAAQALTEFVLGRDAGETMARALALEEWTLHLRVLRHPSFAYGYLLSCADDIDRAREIFGELHRRAAEHGDESALPPILNHLALVECLAGRWREATDHADEAYEIALQAGQRPSQASILSKKALVQARRGLVEEASATAERALALAGGHDFDAARPEPALARGGETALWTLGFLNLCLGKPEAADRFLGPLAEVLLAAGIREPGELRPLPDAIEALIAVERLSEAEALLEQLADRARAADRPSALAESARCRGLLLAAAGDLPAAIAELERAAESPLPFERGRGLVALGQAQRRAKQRRAARETLSQALALFEELGAELYAEKARAELARIGGRAPSGELTVTERRIAELVAEGCSNKEVAAALFVTPKTVETQLSRIYAKLGIHSRTELGRRITEDGSKL